MSASTFVPRWGKHSTGSTKLATQAPRPVAHDVVPHVPFSKGGMAMKSPPAGIYNQPRSHLEPLIKPVVSPGMQQSKSKRDEMWERKRQEFLVRTGRSPPSSSTTSTTISRNDTSVNSGMRVDVNDEAAQSGGRPDFEAAVQALVKKQNQKLVEELVASKQDSSVTNKNAPSPSEPRYRQNQEIVESIDDRKEVAYHRENTSFMKENQRVSLNDSILSPQKTKLGSRLSSMYMDIDARVLERKKKEQYRNELEQQISARSSDKKIRSFPTNLRKNSSPSDDRTVHFQPRYKEQHSKANLQLRYKQELDKQLAQKESERQRNLEKAANPSSLNTVAFPGSLSPSKTTPSSSNYNHQNSNRHMSKAERMRQYKLELDQQIELKKLQASSRSGSRNSASDIGQARDTSPAYFQNTNYIHRSERQQSDYRMDLDNQIAVQQKFNLASHQSNESAYRHENVFSNLGSHELEGPTSRPFGAGGIKTLHKDRHELEKRERVKARKSKYMEDLNRQIEERNLIRTMQDTTTPRKPFRSPRSAEYPTHAQNEVHNVYEKPSRHTGNYDKATDPTSAFGSSFQEKPYLERLQSAERHYPRYQDTTFNPQHVSTIHAEHNLNFSGYGAKQNLIDAETAHLTHQREQLLHRQTELARKKDYGQELKQQMREKKAREDLSKSKRLEEEAKLVAKLKQINHGGKVAAVLGSSAGSGGGGGEPVRDEIMLSSHHQSVNGVTAHRSVSFHQSDLQSNNDMSSRPLERQYSAQASFKHPATNVQLQIGRMPENTASQLPAQQSTARSDNDVVGKFSRHRSGELHPGVEDFHEVQRKQQQQIQYRAMLQEQMEEVKRRKAEEKKKEKEAEERETMRIQREINEMNRKYNLEKDKPMEMPPKHSLTSNGPVAFSPQHKAVPQHVIVQQNDAKQKMPELDLSDKRKPIVNLSPVVDHDPATVAFRHEMEERQRQLQEELQQQKHLVFEMQQKMQLAMLSSQQKNSTISNPSAGIQEDLTQLRNTNSGRRQWKSPPTSNSNDNMIFQGNDLKRSVTPSPSRVKFSSNRNSISSSRRSSSSQRRLRTPVVPDEAFVSRPKLINSLDVSSISEMLAVDQSLPDNSMETSIAGHSKLVDAFIRAGDPLDKTWTMPQSSPSPTRRSGRKSARNRSSLVEQSLQSSSHFVPCDSDFTPGTFLPESRKSDASDQDEQLLTSFTNKGSNTLPAVEEEQGSPTAVSMGNEMGVDLKLSIEKTNEINTSKDMHAENDIVIPTTPTKPSPAMKTVANFLGVDPLVSPSAHNNSDISHMPRPETPPRELLKSDKVENQNFMFEVKTPSREEYQEMLNSSQLSNKALPVLQEDINGKDDENYEEASLNLSMLSDNADLNNTQVENVLNSTVLSQVEDEALL